MCCNDDSFIDEIVIRFKVIDSSGETFETDDLNKVLSYIQDSYYKGFQSSVIWQNCKLTQYVTYTITD